LRDIRKHLLTKEQKDKIIQFAGRFSELPINSLYGPKSINEIYSTANRLKWDTGLDVIFVDYLGLVKDCQYRSAGSSLYERTTHVSSKLFSMAKELGVAVVVACQLNRTPQHRVDKRPEISDLRDSGNIEQDADSILLLHREIDEATQKMGATLSVRPAKIRQGGDKPPINLFWLEGKKRYVDAVKYG